MRTHVFVALFSAMTLILPGRLRAHGFVGDRFFPPTIATDDPFATDELSLPSLSEFEDPGSPHTRKLDTGFEFDKEIFPHFALGIGQTYIYQKTNGQSGGGGWDNTSITAKYELWDRSKII